jgi:hypothetical protein
MKSSVFVLRGLCILALAAFMTACEGQRTAQDISGTTIVLEDWTPMEVSQLRGNLTEVFAGLPLKDAKYSLRNNGQVRHEQVTITDRGVAISQVRDASRRGGMGNATFEALGSRQSFEEWTRAQFPQAKSVQITEVIPVTNPRQATRGHVATVMVTNQQDRSYRCALSRSGYGGPRLSETSTDLFNQGELRSYLTVRLCAASATAASLNERLQRVAF